MKTAPQTATKSNSPMSPLGEAVYRNLCPETTTRSGQAGGSPGPGRGQDLWYWLGPVSVLAFSDLYAGKTLKNTLLIKS